MYDVLEFWIIETHIGCINMESYLADNNDVAKVSVGFSKRYNGLLMGAISAIGCWLDRAQQPSWGYDGTPNPVSFYSCK